MVLGATRSASSSWSLTHTKRHGHGASRTLPQPSNWHTCCRFPCVCMCLRRALASGNVFPHPSTLHTFADPSGGSSTLIGACVSCGKGDPGVPAASAGFPMPEATPAVPLPDPGATEVPPTAPASPVPGADAGVDAPGVGRGEVDGRLGCWPPGGS